MPRASVSRYRRPAGPDRVVNRNRIRRGARWIALHRHHSKGFRRFSFVFRLPSPEEKAKVAASQVFPAQVVRLDVTGSGFDRMSQFRRSLQHVEYDQSAAAQQTAKMSQHRKRSTSGRKKTKKRRNTIACDGDRDAIALAVSKANETDKSGSRSSLRQRLNLVHLLRTTMTTPATTASGAVTSSELSYDESDQPGTANQSIATATDATSHASSELVVQVTSGHLVTATRTRSGAMNTISRLRRLGADHTFASGPAVQVEIHRQAEATPSNGHDQHYELIPSEKEFGTLGPAKPIVLRTVRNGPESHSKADDCARSSSGNWSAGSSLDSDHPRRQHQIHQLMASPLAARSINNKATRPLSPEDSDSVLSGDDCSATTKDGTSAQVSDLDMETSSVYSCDAEGYYTSFQFDSGLKGLKVRPRHFNSIRFLFISNDPSGR